jgi:hypothetical protein
MLILVSMDFGKVLEQESLWLVLLLACNGLYTIPSKFIAVLLLQEVNEEKSKIFGKNTGKLLLNYIYKNKLLNF